MKRRKIRSLKKEYGDYGFIPEYADLNHRFKRRILAMIRKKLRPAQKKLRPKDFYGMPNAFLFRLVTLADKRFYTRSVTINLGDFGLNRMNYWMRWAMTDVSTNWIKKGFSKEMSILRKLYRMIDQEMDCTEIVAKMERMLSDVK